MTVEQIGVDAVRTDGGLVHIRPVGPSDLPDLWSLHARASDRSIYLRYFSLNRAASDGYLATLAAPDAAQHRALLATVGDDVVGMAAFERLSDHTAEVALLVADTQQHVGIGTLLLEHLADLARRCGIAHFVADVLTENGPMIRVFRDLGFTAEMRYDAGTVRVAFDLSASPASIAAADEREALADVASLRPLLEPRSLAVIGASERPGSIGHGLLSNILAGGFTGSVYAVNPRHDSVLGVPAFRTPADLPEAPDLAIIAVPAAQVLDVVRACGVRGVRGLVLISSGFGETGAEGRARQDEVVAAARHFGMRLIGPNCLGVLNTDPAVRLNATFAAMPMQPGGLGLISQSGALGIAVLAAANDCGLATSQFVSIGNKADVSGNDLLLAWEHDDRTQVIALYLESFGNPRKFARIARRVAQRKPIVAIKAGRSVAGQRAGTSHTAAAAASDVVVDALFTQAGVIRVSTMQQMLDGARVLGGQPLPAGPRVVIVGNSGGPGILAADAAEAAGLQVVELDGPTQELLRAAAPSLASSQNPVDLGAGVGADQLGGALAVVLAAADVDAVLVVFADTGVSDPGLVMDRVALVAAGSAKTVVATRVGAAPASLAQPGGVGSLPVFTFPEPAAEALALTHRYAAIKAQRPAALTRPDGIDTVRAREIVGAALVEGNRSGWLSAQDGAELLTCYGIAVCPQRVVSDLAGAERAGEEVGYPLAVKLAGGGTHKTDVGGVRLAVGDLAELRLAFAQIQAAQPGSTDVLIQPMVKPGVELIVGAIQDRHVGPVVMLGLGGVLSDLLADRTFRLAPLGVDGAEGMLADLRLARLLDGYRGGAVVSHAALADLVVRVAALAADLPAVAELDLNPVIGNGADLVAVDARIRVADPVLTPDPLLRQLSIHTTERKTP